MVLKFGSLSSRSFTVATKHYFPCTTYHDAPLFSISCLPLSAFQIHQQRKGRDIALESAHTAMLGETRFVSTTLGKNYEHVAQIRTMGALLSGLAAGILGLTGIMGVLFFIISSAATSMTILSFGCGRDGTKFFPKGSKELFAFESILGGVMTYILAWTVGYDAIYIF